MVSELDQAKNAIQTRENNDPELEEALTGAHRYQLEIEKESNRHKEVVHSRELGLFGRLVGGEGTAPIATAAFVTFVCFIGGLACLITAGNSANSDFWQKSAERLFSIGLAALTFLFGKAAK